jgi:hypothetical protein
MARTLPAAREAFVAAMKRETSGAELTRLIAVLDALIKWSVARPKAVSFHSADSSAGVLAFACADSKTMLWSARVARGDAPKLELHVSAGAEARARIMETLNAHSRAVLIEKDRLRIGFGALKNSAALDAVTSLLNELATAHASNGQRATTTATTTATATA